MLVDDHEVWQTKGSKPYFSYYPTANEVVAEAAGSDQAVATACGVPTLMSSRWTSAYPAKAAALKPPKRSSNIYREIKIIQRSPGAEDDPSFDAINAGAYGYIPEANRQR